MQMRTTIPKRRLFETARDQIIMDILSSNRRVGDIYATEKELCKRLKIGRNTIRMAVTELENAGMIKRRQRVGIVILKKSCPPVPSAAHINLSSASTPRVAFVLPHWDHSAGNFLSTTVLGELRNGDDSQQRFSVEMRLFNDPLDDLPPETSSVIIVDPWQNTIPVLSKQVEKGIKVIAVEPSSPLFLASNIQYNVHDAAYDAVVKLHEQGHEAIGLINNDIAHYTFQQWLNGFVDAHNDLNIPILPNSIKMSILGKRDMPSKKITAWICTHAKATLLAANMCSKLGLQIPQDVAIIGSDDPGNIKHLELGCSLTVLRPDYHALSRLIRQILCHEITVNPGETVHCPMKWDYRESFPQNS
jgi:DNA-binding transcriptional regulator YhcF (GntR family)